MLARCWRFLYWGMLSTLGGMGCLLVTVIFFKLPLHFLIPSIQKDLNLLDKTTHIEFKELYLVWNEWRYPFEIEMGDLRVKMPTPQDPLEFFMPKIVLGINWLNLLRGKLTLTHLAFDRPSWILPFYTKEKDQQGGLDSVPRLVSSALSLPLQTTCFKGLKTVFVRDATLVVKGQEFKPFSCTLRKKARKKKILLTAQFRYQNETVSDVHLQFLPGAQHLLFRVSVTGLDLGKLEGVSGSLSSTLVSYDVKGEYSAKDQRINALRWSVEADQGEPSLVALGTYNKGQLLLKKGQLSRAGFSLDLKGSLDLLDASFPWILEGKKNEGLSVAKLLEVWPRELALAPYEWIRDHIPQGKMEDLSINLQGNFSPDVFSGTDTWMTLRALTADFKCEDFTVNYVEGMPPVHKLYGTARWTLGQLAFSFESGMFDQQKIGQSTILLKGLDQKDQDFEGRFALKGPLANILSILEAPPLRSFERFDYSFGSLTGLSDLNLEITFPLIRSLALKDIKAQATAKLMNVNGQIGVGKKDESLKLGKGDLQLVYNPDRLKIEGSCSVADKASRVRFCDFFQDPSKSSFAVHSSWTPQQLQKLFPSFDWGSYFKGKLDLTVKRKMTGDQNFHFLIDATHAELDFNILNWRKKRGQKGQCSGEFFTEKGEHSIKKLGIKAPNLEIEGEGTVRSGRLNNMTLKKVHIADHTSCRVFFNQGDRGGHLNVLGDRLLLSLGDLDLGKTSKHPYFEKDEPFSLHLRLKKFSLEPGTFFHDFKGHLEGHQGPSGFLYDKVDFKALFDPHPLIDKGSNSIKRSYVSLHLEKHTRSKTLELNSDDVGAFLKKLGLGDRVKKGHMNLRAVQEAPSLPYKGTLKISEFDMTDIPLLARILSLVSPMGFTDIFSGRTQSFISFNSQFSYENDMIYVKEARAKGVNLGFSFHGWINLIKKNLFLRGNIIPVDFLNELLSAIPFVGSLLSGGRDNGLFATQFAVKGPFDRMDVSVNPLYSLTPGFLKWFLDEIDDERSPELNSDL